MSEQFNTAARKAARVDIEWDNACSDVHDKAMSARKIATLALNELDRRDEEVARRQATDEAAFWEWMNRRSWATTDSAPRLMLRSWQECSRHTALAKGALQAEIETLKAQHALDAEVVCAAHREYEA